MRSPSMNISKGMVDYIEKIFDALPPMRQHLFQTRRAFFEVTGGDLSIRFNRSVSEKTRKEVVKLVTEYMTANPSSEITEMSVNKYTPIN